jgi:hypothetical protein
MVSFADQNVAWNGPLCNDGGTEFVLVIWGLLPTKAYTMKGAARNDPSGPKIVGQIRYSRGTLFFALALTGQSLAPFLIATAVRRLTLTTARLSAAAMMGSLLARRHGVAPNQLFTWRRLVAKVASKGCPP